VGGTLVGVAERLIIMVKLSLALTLGQFPRHAIRDILIKLELGFET